MDIAKHDSNTLAASQRREKISALIEGRIPFRDDATWAYHPAAQVIVQVPRWKFFTRTVIEEIKLEPIAFKPSIRGMDMMGCISMSGGMTVYLALRPDGQLMRRVEDRTKNPRFTWATVEDFDTLTDEDVKRIETGTKGDDDLISQAYNEACDQIVKSLGYDTW